MLSCLAISFSSDSSSQLLRSIYISDLTIINTELSGCHVCITPDTHLSVFVINSKVFDAARLVYSSHLETDFSLLVENSSITATRIVDLLLQPTVTHCKLDFQTSNFTASLHSFVSFEADAPPMSHINITARDSHFRELERQAEHVMDVRSCSRHVTLDVQNSSFGYTSSSAIYLVASSVDVIIHGNTFGSNHGSFDMQHCDAETSRQVTISDNRFTGGTYNGQDINLYTGYSQLHVVSDDINISNNYFSSPIQHRSRVGINIHSSYQRIYDQSYTISSNSFINLAGTAIKVGTPIRMRLNITDNLITNSRCSQYCVELKYYSNFEPVKITGNRFTGNYPDLGVIGTQKFPQYHVRDNYYVSRNEFANNSAPPLYTTTPYLTIEENFFENNDNYNLRVAMTNNAFENDVINASLNYWGTSDVNAITRSIYDKRYDDRLPVVDFRPYLGSKDYSDVQDDELCMPRHCAHGSCNLTTG